MMTVEKLTELIEVARGKVPADLVIKNCRIVNPLARTIVSGDIAIFGGKIVGIGNYDGKNEIDGNGFFATAGLIDAHVHIESSMCTPENFSRLVVPAGTVRVFADSHEIANVLGVEGLRFMQNSAARAPLKIHFMAPSCVPATDFEDTGATLSAADVESLLNDSETFGLGEMMNFPGLLNCVPEVLKKIAAAHRAGKIIDGHSPFVGGNDLNAYCAAGIKTDHECSTVEEARERLARGMYVFLRQGSAGKNLCALLPAVTGTNARRCAFCSDDKHPQEIIANGHVNENLRLAVQGGIDVFDAIAMATLNAAECYGLKQAGLIAPGFDADIVLFDNLKDFNARMVFIDGKLVARDGEALWGVPEKSVPAPANSVRVKPFSKLDFEIRLKSENAKVIGLNANSIVTSARVRALKLSDGIFDCARNPGVQKLIVMERHNATGKIGRALVEGFGICGGAIATTVAHDSHNIIAVGDNDDDIFAAISEIVAMGGGIAIAKNGVPVGRLALPVAGLMSLEDGRIVAEALENLLEIARRELKIGSEIDPFMLLSFLALPVIPELKLTARGLFDVNKFAFTALEAD